MIAAVLCIVLFVPQMVWMSTRFGDRANFFLFSTAVPVWVVIANGLATAAGFFAAWSGLESLSPLPKHGKVSALSWLALSGAFPLVLVVQRVLGQPDPSLSTSFALWSVLSVVLACVMLLAVVGLFLPRFRLIPWGPGQTEDAPTRSLADLFALEVAEHFRGALSIAASTFGLGVVLEFLVAANLI